MGSTSGSCDVEIVDLEAQQGFVRHSASGASYHLPRYSYSAGPKVLTVLGKELEQGEMHQMENRPFETKSDSTRVIIGSGSQEVRPRADPISSATGASFISHNRCTPR